MSRKIYLLGPAHPYRGGIASFLERLGEEFLAKSWEVKIFTYTTQYPKILFPGRNQYSTDKPPENLTIERAYSSINPISWLRLRKKIKEEKPDILISKYWLPYVGLSSAFIHRVSKQMTDIRSIAIVDNLIPHQHMPGDRMITTYFVNSLERFIVMSETVKHQFETHYPGKNLIHIPHPLYDNYGEIVPRTEACHALGLNPKYMYVLFFGFIKPYKGLDLLLRSIPKDVFLKKRIKLIIAGEVYGSDRPYKEIIKNRKLEDLVIFHNRFISNEQVRFYFSASDLIAQTYHTATQSGISQLALYFEKPILVTDVGGLSETIDHGKTGYILKPDAQIIEQTIADFFKNSDRNEFRDNIARQKESYTWSHFADSVITFV